MKRNLLPFAILTLVVMQTNALSQSADVPKYEIAAEFTTLERENFGGQGTEPGAGARFTFNFNRSLAFEAAGYFFPNQCSFCRNGGNMSQVVAGAKIGKRFEKWGIFAKARPGVVSFSRGEVKAIRITPGGPFPIEFETNRITSFATDLGGVLEFYPTRKIVTRFDVGDTIIHFRRRVNNGFAFDPTGNVTLIPFTTPARTTHNFQFIAGVGFRF